MLVDNYTKYKRCITAYSDFCSFHWDINQLASCSMLRCFIRILVLY